MKKILISSCIILSAIVFNACNNGNNNKDSVDSAKDANSQKMDSSSTNSTTDSSSSTTATTTPASTTPVDKDDADFAVNAANGGMEEVQMGQLASQNAMNQRVKDFGAMMVKDHSDANNKLKSLAASKNVTLPATISNDAQKDYDKLSKKTGKDFDKAYIDMMVDDHKKDIKDFQKEAQNGKDPDIKNFASTTLPTLQMHLDSIEAIKKSTKY